MPRPPSAPLLGASLTVALTALAAGCATTQGLLHLSGAGGVSTSSWEERRPHGAPTVEVGLEGVLDDPPLVRCDVQTHHPPESVTAHTAGVDTGGRLAIGFIGFGELALGGAMALGASEAEVDAGALWALGAFALADGVATVALAFLLDDYHHVRELERDAWVERSGQCPAEVAMVHRGRRLPVGPDGRLAPEDAEWLIGSLVTWAGPVDLAYGDERTARVEATPEQRCRWASARQRPEALALCPAAPAPAPLLLAPPPPPPAWRLMVRRAPIGAPRPPPR